MSELKCQDFTDIVRPLVLDPGFSASTAFAIEPAFYPDINFEFSESRLVGSPLIPASGDSRIRGVLQALETAGEINNWQESYGQIGDNHTRIANLLNEKGRDGRRNRDLLDPREAAEIAILGLSICNHPYYQVIRQMVHEFPGIKSTERREVALKLLTGLCLPELRKVYQAKRLPR